MKDCLEKTLVATAGISNRQMAEGLRGALQKNYLRILCAAESEWNRRFARADLSDRCARVRISSGDRMASPSAHQRVALSSFSSQAA